MGHGSTLVEALSPLSGRSFAIVEPLSPISGNSSDLVEARSLCSGLGELTSSLLTFTNALMVLPS